MKWSVKNCNFYTILMFQPFEKYFDDFSSLDKAFFDHKWNRGKFLSLETECTKVSRIFKQLKTQEL